MRRYILRMTVVAIFFCLAVLPGGAAAKWDGVIHVGFTGPLSEGAAQYGNNCLTGVKLGVEDVNAKGGILVGGKKYELKLTYYDDMYKPANTVANVRRMVSKDKPICVYCVGSGGSLALEKINEKEGFIISAYSSPVAVKQGNKLVFLVPARFDKAYGTWAVKTAFAFGPKLAQLTDSHEGGVVWQELVDKAWKKLGGQVVSTNSVNYLSVTDFYPYLTKCLQTKPDVINLYGPSEPAAMVINQARELGYKGAFLMGDLVKLDEAAKVASMKNLNNSIGTCAFDRRSGKQEKAFVKRLKKLYGEDYVVTNETAVHYEVVWMVAKAIEKAQTKDDPRAIFSKIDAVLPLGEHGITLRDGIGPNGELLGVTFGIAVKNNKFTEPIPIVWGKELYSPGKTTAWKVKD